MSLRSTPPASDVPPQDAPCEATAIRRLCADLNLPPGHPYTHDWAWELPDPFRTEPYVARYLDAYRDPAYGDHERRLLMDRKTSPWPVVTVG